MTEIIVPSLLSSGKGPNGTNIRKKFENRSFSSMCTQEPSSLVQFDIAN